MVESAVGAKASLWRETWKAIKGVAPSFWPWIVGYGAILAIFYSIMSLTTSTELAQRIQQNPQLLLQPELKQAYMHELMENLAWIVPFLVVASAGYYFFTVKFMHVIMKDKCPDYSAKGYFYWLGKTVWKYVRPMGWVVIPLLFVIGAMAGAGANQASKPAINTIMVIARIIACLFPILYFRSLIRYQLVGPLAILHHGKELRSSWVLTRNNWWRVFGNYLVIGILLALIVFGLSIIPLTLVYFLTKKEPDMMSFHLAVHVLQGMWVSVATAAYSIYACTAYRILLQEKQAQKPLFDASESLAVRP